MEKIETILQVQCLTFDNKLQIILGLRLIYFINAYSTLFLSVFQQSNDIILLCFST